MTEEQIISVAQDENCNQPAATADEDQTENITLTLPVDLLDKLSEAHLDLLKKIPRQKRYDYSFDHMVAYCIQETLLLP